MWNRLLGWLGRFTCRKRPYPALLSLSTVQISVAVGHWSQNNDRYVVLMEKSWPVAAGDIRIGNEYVQQIDSVYPARAFFFEIPPFPQL